LRGKSRGFGLIKKERRKRVPRGGKDYWFGDIRAGGGIWRKSSKLKIKGHYHPDARRQKIRGAQRPTT